MSQFQKLAERINTLPEDKQLQVIGILEKYKVPFSADKKYIRYSARAIPKEARDEIEMIQTNSD